MPLCRIPSRLYRITQPSLVLVLVMAASQQTQSSEDTEPARIKLGPWATDLKVGPSMCATGRHLKGCEFVAQDLRNAVFDGCDLDGVLFYQCNLSGASFRDTRLCGMNITDCQIVKADFRGALINGVVGMSGGLTSPPQSRWPHDMYLSEEQLTSTRSYKVRDLSRCVISQYDRTSPHRPAYNLQSANLEAAYLAHGDFSRCDLSNARIDGISIVCCELAFSQLASTSNFRSARALRGAHLADVRISGRADFSGIDLNGTVFSRVSADDFDFTDADITKCAFLSTIGKDQLHRTQNFKRGQLWQMHFEGLDLSGCDLSNMDLTRTQFVGCDFTRASLAGTCLNGSQFRGCAFSYATLESAVISHARFAEDRREYIFRQRFPDSTGLTVDQIKSTWNYRDNRMEGIVLPKELTEQLGKKRGEN